MESNQTFMREAIALSLRAIRNNEGGPFGCVIVKDGKIVGRGNNQVTANNDPTAHAEVMAIRNACQELGSYQLDDCIVYTSCEPCPMCLGALYWARPAKIYYANHREDAAAIGFDDSMIYREITLPLAERKIPIEPLLREEAQVAFQEWESIGDKKLY
jgi:guanine deaminase